MPILVFPTADVLRVALSSGIVPREWASRPATGHRTESGLTWLDPGCDLPREVIASLVKLGVSLRRSGPPLSALFCWGELIPNRASCDNVPGRHLIEVPADCLVRLWTTARQVGVDCTFFGWAEAKGWLLSQSLPESLQELCSQQGQVFVERRAGIWVEVGTDHPLTEHLDGAKGPILIPAQGAWRAGPIEPLQFTELPMLVARFESIPKRPQFTGRFRLVSARDTDEASIWVIEDVPPTTLQEWLASTTENVLASLRIARLTLGSRTMMVIAGPRGGVMIPPISGAVGYSPHPRLTNLYLQQGQRLSPPARTDILREAFHLGPRQFGLMMTQEGRVICHRLPIAAFQPATRLIKYIAPPTKTLVEPATDWSRLAMPRFVVEPESATALSVVSVLPQPRARAGQRRAWLTRFLPARLPSRGRQASKPVDAPNPVRALDKLNGPQALTLGNEWIARRAMLERRVLAEVSRADPARRATLWTELGEVYTAMGNLADAAVAHLNATWCNADSQTIHSWLNAELKLARLPHSTQPEAILALATVKPAAARLACATLCHAASLAVLPGETLARLPELAKLIDPMLPDLPLRAAWLGFRALDMLSSGDVLTLARGRDKLFDRMAAHGPSLDVDAPSFLRFRGVTGERHGAARDWMTRVREPLHRWLGRLATPGRLQWAGLDGDPAGTTAYADLMLAWGLARLGDRTRANDLEAQAARALSTHTPPGADPRVPSLLLDAYRHRTQAAADGRSEVPGLPGLLRERYAELDELGRYAVDKLRAVSVILEPGELIDPYGGRGVATFLGRDPLGERLTKFLAARELLPRAADARELLALGPADPTATTMPRVIFALLETAPRLDVELVAALLPQTIRAVELIPEWVRRSSPLTDPNAVASRIGKRMLESACHAASLFHLRESFAAMTEELLRQQDGSPDGAAPSLHLVESVAGLYFRTLRRLGLSSLAALLLGRLTTGTSVGARELGLSVGLFTIGNEEAGNKLLDAARERLLVRGISDDHERTSVAVAYALTLGEAPPGIALGRLEELFQRLEMVSTAGTANRYYTLHPLRLVDAAVRSAVGDDFAIGAGVRSWLAEEEFATRTRVTADFFQALRGAEGRVQYAFPPPALERVRHGGPSART